MIASAQARQNPAYRLSSPFYPSLPTPRAILDTMKLLLSLVILFSLASAKAPTIGAVHFSGTPHTTQATLFALLELDSSATFTAAYEDTLRHNLMYSYLFNAVHFTTAPLGKDTIALFIKVDEKPRWTLTDIGLGIFNRLYGEEKVWLHFNAAVTNKNFLGKGQTLKLYGGLWTSRYIGIIWQIPLYKHDYLLTFNSRLGHYPSLSRNYNVEPAFEFGTTLGKYITKEALVEIGIMPSIRKYHEASDQLAYFEDETPFQLYTTLRGTFDYRNDRFNPHTGVFSRVTLFSNVLAPYHTPQGVKKAFLQSNIQLRGFIPAGKHNQFALRSDLLITPAGEHSFYEQIYMGGSATLRGYGDNALGAPVDSTPFYNSTVFNNRFLASAEFRFRIHAFKPINFKFLSWYHESMKAFPIELHGAVFIDAGYLWKEIETMFDYSSGTYLTAGSAGVGLRILFPSIDMKGGMDFGWPIKSPYPIAKPGVPVFHMFMGFPF